MPPHLTGPPIANTERRPQKVLKIEILQFILMNLTRGRPSDSLRAHLPFFYTQLSHAGLVSTSTHEGGQQHRVGSPDSTGRLPQRPIKECLPPVELLLTCHLTYM